MLSNKLNRGDSPSSAHEVFRLAHLSDPHVISSSGVRLRELLNKRVYGYLSWHLRRHAEHRDEVLAALREDLAFTDPDHIALTGDLTHLGLPSEFLEAQALLQSLGPPSKVMVVPGNHDAYVATAWERTFRLWSDYMASDADQDSPRTGKEDPRAGFPTLRVRGDIALIGVSTAYPTPPLLAIGSIGKGQLEKLSRILDETGRRRLVRVVLIHHPPVPGAVRWRNRLTDQEAFHALLARHGAELILHGHTHRTCSGHLETPWGRVSVIGVPSASALGRTARRRARYHLFRLMRTAGALEMLLTVRAYSPTEQRFVEEGEQRVPLPLPPG
jgi:3',5'-cyclic AMP phosphodiesterase CpdA